MLQQHLISETTLLVEFSWQQAHGPWKQIRSLMCIYACWCFCMARAFSHPLMYFIFAQKRQFVG